MEEVSAYLKEQMRAKETLERLRSSNELEIRKCHVKEREELQASNSCVGLQFVRQNVILGRWMLEENGNF